MVRSILHWPHDAQEKALLWTSQAWRAKVHESYNGMTDLLGENTCEQLMAPLYSALPNESAPGGGQGERGGRGGEMGALPSHLGAINIYGERTHLPEGCHTSVALYPRKHMLHFTKFIRPAIFGISLCQTCPQLLLGIMAIVISPWFLQGAQRVAGPP